MPINTNLNKGKEQIVQEGNRYKRLFANELVSSMKGLLVCVCVCEWQSKTKTSPKNWISGVNDIPMLWDLRQPNCSNRQSLSGDMSIRECWPGCCGIWTERQLNKMESVRTSRHSRHRRLFDFAFLLAGSDVLSHNTHLHPSETNILGFVLHGKQQRNQLENQTIVFQILFTFHMHFLGRNAEAGPSALDDQMKMAANEDKAVRRFNGPRLSKNEKNKCMQIVRKNIHA